MRRLAGLEEDEEELDEVLVPEAELPELEPVLEEPPLVVEAELPEESVEEPLAALPVPLADSVADELTQEESDPEIVTGEVNAVAPVPSLIPRVLTENGKATTT